MLQTNREQQQYQKPAKTCANCGRLYEPAIAFCPTDGTRLADALVDTDRQLNGFGAAPSNGFQSDASEGNSLAATVPDTRDTLITGSQAQADDNPRDPARLIGKIIDSRYRIQSILGSGGMSVVYSAMEIYLNKRVALKMLLPHMTSLPVSLQRFQQEARSASNLNHQNIISVFSFGSPEGQAYLAMDYLEGVALSDIVGEGKCLPVARAVHIFTQIAEGLDHAHRRGVVHRDLKPSNVILIKFGADPDFVKILDFGIAKLLNPDDSGGVKLTQTGEVFGSPMYMSPEQARGLVLDARSDIYSLGCLMYETLQGEPPHTGTNSIELMYKHINEVPAPFTSDRKIPQRLERIVFKALAKDVHDRYDSMATLRQDLIAFTKEQKYGLLGKITDRLQLIWLKRKPTTRREKAIASICAVSVLLTIVLGIKIGMVYTQAASSEASKRRLAWQEPDAIVTGDNTHSEVRLRKKSVEPEATTQLRTFSSPFGQSSTNEQITQLTQYGGILTEKGHFSEALITLRQAFKLNVDFNGPHTITSNWLRAMIADCEYRLGELDQAKETLETLLHESRTSVFPYKVIAHDHYLLGNILSQENDNVGAEHAYIKALSVWASNEARSNLIGSEHATLTLNFAPVPLSEEYAMCVAKLGDVERKLNDLDKASRCYKTAIAYFKNSNDDMDRNGTSKQDQLHASTIINQAIATCRLGSIELLRSSPEALNTYQEAIAVMEPAAVGSNKAFLALLEKEYADALWSHSEYFMSLQHQYRSLELFGTSGSS